MSTTGSNAFSVELDTLDQTVDQLAAFGALVEQRLHELDSHIARLHASWTGPAAQAQRDAHREWLAGAQEIAEGLRALRSAAQTAHSNYTAAVSTNRKNWLY